MKKTRYQIINRYNAVEVSYAKLETAEKWMKKYGYDDCDYKIVEKKVEIDNNEFSAPWFSKGGYGMLIHIGCH